MYNWSYCQSSDFDTSHRILHLLFYCCRYIWGILILISTAIFFLAQLYTYQHRYIPVCTAIFLLALQYYYQHRNILNSTALYSYQHRYIIISTAIFLLAPLYSYQHRYMIKINLLLTSDLCLKACLHFNVYSLVDRGVQIYLQVEDFAKSRKKSFQIYY